jgi:hypothetical protein
VLVVFCCADAKVSVADPLLLDGSVHRVYQMVFKVLIVMIIAEDGEENQKLLHGS